jgi:hypothetical protein
VGEYYNRVRRRIRRRDQQWIKIKMNGRGIGDGDLRDTAAGVWRCVVNGKAEEEEDGKNVVVVNED